MNIRLLLLLFSQQLISVQNDYDCVLFNSSIFPAYIYFVIFFIGQGEKSCVEGNDKDIRKKYKIQDIPMIYFTIMEESGRESCEE